MNACMDDRMKEQWMSHNGMEEVILRMIHDALHGPSVAISAPQ